MRVFVLKNKSFLTVDTYRGEFTEPETLHLYAYCINNPISYSNLSGHKTSGVVKIKYKTSRGSMWTITVYDPIVGQVLIASTNYINKNVNSVTKISIWNSYHSVGGHKRCYEIKNICKLKENNRKHQYIRGNLI